MTSVQSRRQPLSGNKGLKALLLVAALAVGCSPKTRVMNPPTEQRPAKTITKPVEKPRQEPVTREATASVISMLLPLKLEELSGGYSAADLKQANMGIDYYQGFKLALDSLTAEGYNFRLQLFDSKDQAAEARNLSLNPKVRNSDLIVGPIFPDGIKAFSETAIGKKKMLLSPLSPAAPNQFHNPMLITATPPLDYHAKRAARYVAERLKPKKVFILKSGFSEDNKYITPFKHELDSLSRLKIKVVPFTVVRGNLQPLLAQLSKTEENVFIIPAVKQAFLGVTLRSLDAVAKTYPVTVIGHPNWENMSFLKADLLQRLKTVITSTEHVNYKLGSTVTFVRAYRKAYHIDPSLYAIKGFDEGYFFGHLIAESNGAQIKPELINYDGIHNDFHFVKQPGIGWINAHVSVLKYSNFELKVIE
ncbi:ABC transporter substrate-binding protein [Mucilaginibacter sp. KACC 22063]|uniref:ABC transporter substrate-binding protein n=1 Tax=Mucilaginibacter sp. KACC 22063 TaxID=3025666 RepID=UPI0023672AE0|nr:ABC transporter substrate-binding protein [Mucilaginibacter sp. KACC 22063]WDF54525.1 ABC transporter substrate-binding protein [Mucilaginibacter sp. KACC 22063]